VTDPRFTHRSRLAAVTLALLLLSLVLSSCGLSTRITTGGATSDTPDDNGSGMGVNVYSPYQMRVAYGVESLYKKGMSGKGQTVVIIDSFGSPTLQKDLDVFSDKFNLPKTTVKVLTPLGTKPFDSNDDDMTGWAVETTLDVEMVHAMAPGANIVVLTSPVAETEGVQGFPEFLKLMQYARDNNLGSVVSQSYGASEISLEDAAGRELVAQMNDFYQQATTQSKMTFFASSGDGGASDYASADDAANQVLANERTTSFPHAVPWITSVGGTELTIRGSSVSESAWQGGKAAGDYRRTLQRALDDAWRGEFSVLIIWALDRITREGAEGALRVIRLFRERGCTIVSVKESWLNGSPEVQDVLVAFAGWMAEQESARRSARVKAGLARRKAEGKPVGRQPGTLDKRPRRRSGYVARWEREREDRS
jgi:hypothetical protein